ncbi:MAG: hypothetical protein DRH90_20335 [Deltaproteobacteria bacterium]|nr:MAG: hypothetical protein DRH90_20335 [Deltaproteobacteria bacterium]
MRVEGWLRVIGYKQSIAYSPTRINRKRKRSFITKTRKYETTKKTMKLFVVFRFRVFVIAFTIFATKYINLQLRD